MGMKRMGAVLGVAGTAKNTGKTTTLNGIMREALARDRRILVTSIGFDGEDIDNVTGLPKPRIHCGKGVAVATASKCLGAGSARIRIEVEPGIDTALGRMVIGTVQSGGLVVLAGPNKTSDLERLLSAASGIRDAADLTLVDGAFARMAPMSLCDALVLATGAARNTSARSLADETAGIVKVLSIPGWSGRGTAFQQGGDRIVAIYEDGRAEDLPTGSMLGAQDIPGDVGALTGVFIPGAVSPGALHLLVSARSGDLRGCEIIIGAATNLLASGDPGSAARALESVEASGGRVYAMREVRLLAVTVNPFYPERLPGGAYEKRFVDPRRLLAEMRRAVRSPVHDVVMEGTAELGSLVDALVVDSSI